MKTLPLALVCCLLGGAGLSTAQSLPTPKPKVAKTPLPNSLAETIKKGRDKKKEEPKKSLGSITNESLKEPSGKSKKGTLSIAGTAASKGETQGEAAKPNLDIKDDKGRTEDDWKRMVTETRNRETTAKAEIARLEKETRRLENDFYAWSDGNYRDRMIKPAWDQAKDDLRKARLELDASQLAMSDLEEEARRSGANPGWLRVR